MSAAVPPWGGGFESRFFSKIGNLRNFLLYTSKIVFFGHTLKIITFKRDSSITEMDKPTLKVPMKVIERRLKPFSFRGQF
jgi:hypothetical protein